MQSTLDAFFSQKKVSAEEPPLKKSKQTKTPKTRSRDLDQFYTRQESANAAIELLLDLIPQLLSTKARWIEPSVGNGAFYNAVCHKLTPHAFDAIDIDEKRKMLQGVPASVRQLTVNFMDYNAVESEEKCICVGNPPFGKNASLALDFINHAEKFCDVIAFILPNSFHKLSIMNRVSRNLHLISKKAVKKDAFIYEKEVVHVPSTWFVFVHRKCKWTTAINTQNLRELIVPYPVESKYITFQANGPTNETTFMIQRVGMAAGKVTLNREEWKGKETSKNFYFVIIHFEHIKCAEAVRNDFDLQHIKEKHWTAGMPSISKSEVVKYLTEFIESK